MQYLVLDWSCTESR